PHNQKNSSNTDANQVKFIADSVAALLGRRKGKINAHVLQYHISYTANVTGRREVRTQTGWTSVTCTHRLPVKLRVTTKLPVTSQQQRGIITTESWWTIRGSLWKAHGNEHRASSMWRTTRAQLLNEELPPVTYFCTLGSDGGDRLLPAMAMDVAAPYSASFNSTVAPTVLATTAMPDSPLPCNGSGAPPMEEWSEKLNFYMNGVLTAIVTGLGLVGNALAVMVLTRRTMHTSTNCFLTALAIWDSVVLLHSLLLMSLGEIVPGFFTHALPYVIVYLYPVALVAQTATVWLTVSFTVERYIAVCHPLKAASMCTIQRARIVIVIISVISVLYNMPRWFEYTLMHLQNPISNVTCLGVDKTGLAQNSVYHKIYFGWLYFLVMCFIPLCSLAVLNAFLVLAVKRSQRQRKDMNVRQSFRVGRQSLPVLVNLRVNFLILLGPRQPSQAFRPLLLNPARPFRVSSCTQFPSVSLRGPQKINLSVDSLIRSGFFVTEEPILCPRVIAGKGKTRVCSAEASLDFNLQFSTALKRAQNGYKEISTIPLRLFHTPFSLRRIVNYQSAPGLTPSWTPSLKPGQAIFLRSVVYRLAARLRPDGALREGEPRDQ
ncbi:hypothetical protein BaRGS_00027408, partial [Batillaria attramentaria]